MLVWSPLKRGYYAHKIRTVQKIIQPPSVVDFGDVQLWRATGPFVLNPREQPLHDYKSGAFLR
jgi:hypothetical protein